MDWLVCVRKAIGYMEEHLKDDISAQDIADEVYISPMFLQKGFTVITGMTVTEYIRNRRLSLAAETLRKTDAKIIDIAFDYRYETPESFTKAFTRFHGVSPSQVRAGAAYKTFLPINIIMNVRGGNNMDFKVTKMFPLKVIGFQRTFSSEDSYSEIPKFWDEICDKYAANVYAGNPPANAYEKALMDNCIGEYGVCVDDIGCGKFRYLIAGKYCGGEVPAGMALYEFPMTDWAIFDCVGPIPDALQTLNTKIFREWLPGNPDYELDGNASVEWYDCVNGNKTDADYHSAIWLPVRKR